MIRRSVPIVAPAVLLAVLAAVPMRAADDVLGVIPDGSLGFVLINQLAQTDAKAVELGRRMQLPVPSLLAMLKLSTGALQGLDE